MIICGLQTLILIITAIGINFVATAAQPKIMIIHSYDKEFSWVKEVNDGFSLYSSGKNLFGVQPLKGVRQNHHHTYYMNTKTKNEIQKRQVALSMINNIQREQPDVVIVCDDDALRLVAAPLKKQNNLKFVFLGINNDPRSYGVVKNYQKPEYNITGILSEHPFNSTLEIAQKIMPKRRKLVVFNESTRSGQGILKSIMKHIRSHPIFSTSVDEIIVDNDWDHWKKVIKKYQSKEHLFVFATFQALKSKGRPISNGDVRRWILRHSKVPELAISSSSVEHGMLLAVSNPGVIHGYMAFDKAARLSKGRSTSEEPVEPPRGQAVRLNMNRARLLGITVPTDIINLATIFDELGY